MKLAKQALVTAIIVASSAAEAIPTLNFNSSNELTGVSNIEIEGTNYNVDFEIGFCNLLFTGCDNKTDFLFQSAENATAASLALSETVISTFQGEIAWSKVSGYNFILTPYDVLPDVTGYNVGTVKGIGIGYGQLQGELFDIPHWISEYNFGTIWAKWERNDVPTPPTFGLLLIGFSALLFRTIRSRAKQ